MAAGWFLSEATRLDLHLRRQRWRPHVGSLPATQRIAVGVEPQPFHWQAKLFFAGAWWQANEQNNWPFSFLNDQQSVKLVSCIPLFWSQMSFLSNYTVSISHRRKDDWFQSRLNWANSLPLHGVLSGLLSGSAMAWYICCEGPQWGCCTTSHLICSRSFPGVFAGWWNVTILTHNAVYGKERWMELGVYIYIYNLKSRTVNREMKGGEAFPAFFFGSANHIRKNCSPFCWGYSVQWNHFQLPEVFQSALARNTITDLLNSTVQGPNMLQQDVMEFVNR